MRTGALALKGTVSPIAEVFRLPDLRRLALGNAVSLIGFWGYGIAVSIYAFDVGGAALVGIAWVFRLVPSAALAPFMAVFADRYSRRAVLLWSNAIQALLICLAAAMIWQGLPPAAVFFVATIVTITASAYEPARSALIPELVEKPRQLTTANVAMSSLESASIFIGPAIGGLILAFFGVEIAFLTTAAFLVVTHFFLARISIREDGRAGDGSGSTGEESEEGEEAESGLAVVLGGFRVIGRDRNLALMVFLTAVQLMVFGMLSVLVVAVAIDELGIGEAGVGYLNSAIGVGGLIGALVAVSLTGKRGLGAALVIGLFGWGLPIAVIGVSPLVVVAMAMMTVIGIANTVVDGATNTLLQRIIPEDLRGRVYGVLESVIVGAIALGALLAPLIIELADLRVALIVSGLILPVVAVFCRPALARIDREFAPPAERVRLLEASSIFEPLAPSTIEQLALSLGEITAPAGEAVVTQGEEGELFYLIESGRVEVFEDGVKVREEGPGESFGEIALLREVPRTATVKTIEDSTFLTLTSEDFLEAVVGNPLSSEAAERVVATRLGAGR